MVKRRPLYEPVVVPRTSTRPKAPGHAEERRASSLLNDLLMQRRKQLTGQYSGTHGFTLD